MLIAGEFESYSMLVVFCCCLCRILVLWVRIPWLQGWECVRESYLTLCHGNSEFLPCLTVARNLEAGREIRKNPIQERNWEGKSKRQIGSPVAGLELSQGVVQAGGRWGRNLLCRRRLAGCNLTRSVNCLFLKQRQPVVYWAVLARL